MESTRVCTVYPICPYPRDSAPDSAGSINPISSSITGISGGLTNRNKTVANTAKIVKTINSIIYPLIPPLRIITAAIGLPISYEPMNQAQA